MSNVEPEVWMVQWTYDGEVWVDAHADEPRARDQARDRGGECLPMVREESAQAEIGKLRAAHLSIGELPSGMVSKIVAEIVSWGDQCAGGGGREIIPSGPNEGKPYGHTYYEAAAALGALFEDARTALSGSKE